MALAVGGRLESMAGFLRIRERKDERGRSENKVVGSLVFVPAVFTVMDDVAGFGWRLFARFVGPTEEPAAPAQIAPPAAPPTWPMAAE